MAANEFAPVTPGEMIKQEFLVEYGLSQNQLAKRSPGHWWYCTLLPLAVGYM
jgi:hypothetical protein